ncbi:hypothetical protein DIS24_g8892 [Lasiodiplodia hormozganensis]|uniref:Uncharacterized protein n=1 Tax=Lasiodiplodia hormozganensis TaxID=869390 RepID=A0AA39XYF2_9PEZI|nr:hypothetical protein DIS24_g8892 [Lasiodiplodia hormozganensis]
MSPFCLHSFAVPLAFFLILALVWREVRKDRAHYESLHPSEKTVALAICRDARRKEEEIGFDAHDEKAEVSARSNESPVYKHIRKDSRID